MIKPRHNRCALCYHGLPMKPDLKKRKERQARIVKDGLAFESYWNLWSTGAAITDAGRWLSRHVGELHARVEELEREVKRLKK